MKLNRTNKRCRTTRCAPFMCPLESLARDAMTIYRYNYVMVGDVLLNDNRSLWQSVYNSTYTYIAIFVNHHEPQHKMPSNCSKKIVQIDVTTLVWSHFVFLIAEYSCRQNTIINETICAEKVFARRSNNQQVTIIKI